MPYLPPFITELDDEDARWLDGAGERRRVRAGEEIVPEGVPPHHLFVVIEGEFEASPAPGGAVRAATDGVLLCIAREELEAKAAGRPAQAKKPAEPAPERGIHVPTMIEKLLDGDF